MGNGYLINCDFFNVEELFEIAPFNNSKSIRAIDYNLFFMLLNITAFGEAYLCIQQIFQFCVFEAS